MIASPHQRSLARGSDRWVSGVAVALVHLALGFALLTGLSVSIARRADVVASIDVRLLPAPPILPKRPLPQRPSAAPAEAAPRDVAGGSTGPLPRHLQAPAALVRPTAVDSAPGGDSAGHGSFLGTGNGGGDSGGAGSGGGGDGDGGGTDLELLTGSIEPSDYPRTALKAGIGGRVDFRFTVDVRGRATACIVTRSSGNAELDAATCRVVSQRFHYRPSTDAAGRPVADQVDGEHIWSTDARGRPE